MDLGSARLVFEYNPLSPGAVLVGLALAGLLVFYGISIVQAVGKSRGLALLTLRTFAMATLAIIMLQPALVRFTPVSAALPEAFNEKNVVIVEPDDADSRLPPLAALAVPELEPKMDVTVSGVVVPPVAFYKSECTVRVNLVNDGPAQAGEIAIYKLARNQVHELARQKLVLESGRQDIGLAIMPEVIGQTAYAVWLTGFAQDRNPENNSALFSLTVARDSTRVLHIAGHPSWDVRFLRQFLVATPGVELISFYLLVEAEDFAPHSREELALIPFPTDELFLKEIGNFDLIIVQNFPLGTYFLLRDQHLDRMRRYVEEGGGILFLGGDRAYGLGEVQTTAVAELFPVELEAGEEGESYARGPLGAQLAPDGLAHPIMTFGGVGDEESLSLSQLPQLAGVNRLGAVAKGGSLLATASNGDEVLPLIVAGRYGKGRVLVVATDSLWKWAFPARLSHDSPTVYRRFFLNALAWLTRDPRTEELEIVSEEGAATAGEETSARVCIKGTAGPGAVIKIRAEWLDVGGKLPAYRLELEAPLTSSRCGTATLPAAKAGAWVVQASLETEVADYEGSSVLVVQNRRPSGTEVLRERIAPLLARRFHPLVLDRKFTVALGKEELEFRKPQKESIWYHPLFFAAFISFLLVEWALRKRWGYL